MKDLTAYPAIFTSNDGHISITFPDLPGCLSCADNYPEAVYWARDALALRLYSDECDKIPFPPASSLQDIAATLKHNQSVTLIDVDMAAARMKLGNKAVNKMVTLPQWLISEAKEAGINFSHTLRDALIEKLRE